MTEPMILTVGHSTHPFEEFTALLRSGDVGALVDVRRLPGSNKYPWFNEDALAHGLPAEGISYQRIAELGGRRNVQRDVPPEVNGFWQNRSFHNYADYALGEEFGDGLEQLISLSTEQDARRVAIMCSEAVWWRCHRRIIADHLLAQGIEVGHLMPDGRIRPAELTPGATIVDARVEYPREAEPA